MLKKFIIIFLFLLGTNTTYKAYSQNANEAGNKRPIVKSSVLTRDTIVIGDQVAWRTVFTAPENSKIAFLPYSEILKRTISDTTGGMPAYGMDSKIEVIREIELDTLSLKNGMSELEAKLIFTSFDSGYYKLPEPLIVIERSPELSSSGNVEIILDTLKIDTPSLAVNTIQIDTAKFQMYDIKGQIKYPITFKEVYPWILLLLFVIALAYVIYRYIKYRRENKDFFGKSIVKDPPHIIALRELEKLRNQKLWQNGKQKQFYTGITDTLREYIEGRYNVSAMEKTSSEILDELCDKKIEKRIYDKLDELLKVSDLVKFAKYIPLETENEEAIPNAVTFVNSTFMQSMEEEMQTANKESDMVEEKEHSDAKKEIANAKNLKEKKEGE